MGDDVGTRASDAGDGADVRHATSRRTRYLRFAWTQDSTTGNQPRVTSIYFGTKELTGAGVAETAGRDLRLRQPGAA